MEKINFIGKKIFDIEGNKKEIIFTAKQNEFILLLEDGTWVDLKKGIGKRRERRMINFEDEDFSKLVYSDKILKFLWMPLEELELSVRTYNCIKRMGANCLSEVFFYERKASEFYPLGRKSIDELIEKLNGLGVTNDII